MQPAIAFAFVMIFSVARWTADPPSAAEREPPVPSPIATLPPPKPQADPADPARLERARTLVEQSHCNVCHRADFSGQENVPRLAGQREDYLLKALREYKSGARHGYEPTMAEVLQPIDDAPLVEFAHYLSRLP